MWIVVVALFVVATSTACLQVEQVVEVHDTDRVDLALLVEPERALGTRNRPQVDVEAVAAALGRSLGPDSVTVVDTPGGDGLQVRIETTPQQLAEPLELPGLGIVRLFERFDLTRSGDDWAVDAVVLPLDAAFEPAPVVAGVSTAVSAPGRDGLASSDYELRIRLPGRIAGTNADEFSGSEASWRIGGGAGAAPQSIRARSVPADPLNPAVVAVGAALAAMGIGVLVIVQASELESRHALRRLRNRSLRDAAAVGDWSDVAVGGVPSDRRSVSRSGGRAVRRRPGDRRPGDRREGTDRRRVAATPVVHGGMYDLGDDDSVAIPVGGNAWGPPPPAQDGVVTGARSEPPRISALPDEPDRPPPGWYPDPAGSAGDRFWDGAGWTATTRPGPQTGPPADPPGAAGTSGGDHGA